MSYAEGNFEKEMFWNPKKKMHHHVWCVENIKTIDGKSLPGFRIYTKGYGNEVESIFGNVTIKKVDDNWWSFTDHTNNFYIDLYC